MRSEDWGTHILGASRGLLCDSYAVLYLNDIGQKCSWRNLQQRRLQQQMWNLFTCVARGTGGDSPQESKIDHWWGKCHKTRFGLLVRPHNLYICYWGSAPNPTGWASLQRFPTGESPGLLTGGERLAAPYPRTSPSLSASNFGPSGLNSAPKSNS